MKDTKNIILDYNDEGEMKTAYIHLKSDLKDSKAGESKKQVTYDGFESEEAKKEGVEFIVDFDDNNKIIGIEILSNRDIIPEKLK